MIDLRIFLAAFMLLPVYCVAQDQGEDSAGDSEIKLAKEDDNHPCAKDLLKFCESLQNGDRMEQWNCLQTNSNNLSKGCKKELGLIATVQGQKATKTQRSASKGQPARKSQITGNHPCKPDLAALCSDVKGNPEKEIRCLQSYPEDTSEQCLARLRKDARMSRKKRTRPAAAQPAENSDQP